MRRSVRDARVRHGGVGTGVGPQSGRDRGRGTERPRGHLRRQEATGRLPDRARRPDDTGVHPVTRRQRRGTHRPRQGAVPPLPLGTR